MGVFIAMIVILFWSSHLFYTLEFVKFDFSNPIIYIHVFIQTYLYTGLFITGHDAMHRTVSKNISLNNWIGRVVTFLFAGLSFKKLIKNHFLHHKYPGTDKDPDFYVNSQNYFIWFFMFMYRYTTILQLVIMGIFYNLLKLRFEEINILFFWVIPAFLSASQLFFFGTFLPHRYPHIDSMKPHNARTQNKNHFWAMLSCYFFGYHFEHHDSPHTPWWQLYKMK